jgi:hypothetical protein
MARRRPWCAACARSARRPGLTSLLLHYPPYYGHDKAMRSLRLFAERVMPQF